MTITCFGDSITQGAYLDFPADAWPALVARRLGVPVDNRGVGGSILHNSDPVGHPTRLMVADAVSAAVESWACNPPAVAVVLAGHNDVIEHEINYSQPMPVGSVEQSKWAAVGVDSTLRAAGVQHVLWVTLCPRAVGTLTDGHPTWPGIIQARISDWNTWLSAWLAPSQRIIDTRGRLGDTAGGLGDPAFYIGDGLHPNAPGGHRVIADRVAAAIAPRLGIALSSTAAL